MLEQIQNKISTLTKAINSPVTPNGTREIMKQQVAKLQSQVDAINLAKKKAEEVVKTLATAISNAYVLANTKGYVGTEQSINHEGTEITIKVNGESPIVDDEDAKSITDAVLKFKGTTHEIILQEPPYAGTATVDICSVKINDTQVTGKIFLIMNPSLND